MSPRARHLSLLLAALTAAFAGCSTGPFHSRTGVQDSLGLDAAEARRAAAHAHYMQGIVLDQEEQHDQALQEFHQAAILDSSNEELVVEVARRWIVRNNPDRALDVLKASAAQPDASPMVDVLLGAAYVQAGKTNQAIQANQRAIRKAPWLLAGHQNLYLDYLQSGRANEAVAVLDAAARQKDADPDFLIGLAELYVNYGSAVPAAKTNAQARALAQLNRASSMPMPNVQTRIRLADDLAALGEPEKAATLYEGVLVDYPQDPMVQENLRAKLTNIYLRGQDHSRAVAQLEAITRNDPMNQQAHYYLALLASEAGDHARAEEHLRQVLVLNPKFEQAYYDLATAQINQRKIANALETLEDARKRFGETFVSECLVAFASAAAGRFEEAVKHYNGAEVIARATDPKRLTPWFYCQMANAHERFGQYSEAVKDLEKALEMKPDYAEAANFLGYMWAERGENLDRARELIELAVKAEPENAAYLDSLAWVLFKQGHPKEALPIMLKVIDLTAAKEPDPMLYDHLGDIQFALGDTAGARNAWTKSLELKPDDEVRRKLDRLPSP
jgi:tetratricopeptide (TPR) repeat protein